MNAKVGSKVIVKNIGWTGNGSSESPLRRCDEEGIVTSKKGVTHGHTNVHKYEVTCKHVKYYTDNKNGELTLTNL